MIVYSNEKAPTVGTTMEANQGGAMLSCCVSCNDNTILQESRQVVISDYLRHGGANAIPARELAKLTGWTPREVTRAVEYERRHGVPICANGRGYFLPAWDHEVDTYLRSLQHREAEVKKTRQAVAATQQVGLDDVQRADGGGQ